MNQETTDLVKYRLEKARMVLADAKNYISGASLFSTVNRLYYAMFYAVNALLTAKGLSSSKHAGVRSLFHREFINKGLLYKELGRIYTTLFDFRQKGDYQDYVKFEKPQVEAWLAQVEIIISQVEALALMLIAE